ncbi:MAG: co-chaperone YbbN [Cypionkella sp.]|nr:co-chaperone YbbN [Cypionkella sp.]
MFGIPSAGAAKSASPYVKDSNEATFMADVIDASMEVPVIVDFWAPWCGPCKTLGPALEAAVDGAKGRVKMVKVNVDENQGIAGQLRIQSIPTVYAFFQGKPVDGFQGAVPPSEIARFVEKLVAMAPEADGGLADAIAAADAMLEEGAVADAIETYAAVLEEDPENAAAYAGLIRAHFAMGDLDRAEELLSAAPDAIANAKELAPLRAQLDLARAAAAAGPEDDLRAQLAADPTNRQAYLDLALALHGSGKVEEAVSTLLDLFKLDREWNDGAARAQLFKIFDALPAQDPIVLAGRRRLSSMIFA